MAGHHSGSSIWELSLYETQRKPHEVFTDSTVIGVSPRALHSELMCPICLDLMKTTLTTKECLHRFCQECIITALRSGNKECPTCRKKLVSKRSLRADPNFDALISKIYPNRDELLQQQQQQQQQQLLQDKQRVAKPLWQCGVQKRKLPQRRQGTPTDPDTAVDSEQLEEKRPRIEQPEEPTPRDETPATEEKETKEEGPVELQLRPHPQDDSLSDEVIRNVSTTPNATVAHLAKFLSIQNQHPHLVGTSHYSLAIQLSAETHEYQVLGNGITLKQICENYWLPGEKLMLFFKLSSDK